ncbi:Uncharacterised protein [Hafnia alvei]|uniref:Uncharacterized protein n=1 Tax=Hafnia alvei TaxID=569 RepID=A0A377PEE9_HAFAL|nr:Uncharacterised protein [Hafnia alvei]
MYTRVIERGEYRGCMMRWYRVVSETLPEGEVRLKLRQESSLSSSVIVIFVFNECYEGYSHDQFHWLSPALG